MKIALIQDSLLVPAGTERVFKYIIEEFDNADIFTLAYNESRTLPEFKLYNIKVSWANIFIKNHDNFKKFFPIATYIMQYWNFYNYDIIISSSATTAKYISRFSGKHYCFGYYPTRAIWDADEYFEKRSIKGKVFKFLLPYFKKRDLDASQRVYKFIAQSKKSSQAFKEIYNVNAPIINSPIDYDKFKIGIKEPKSDNYLIVSRLVHWKKIEYAIHAFNKIGKTLKIIGTGELLNQLKSISNNNIKFLGELDDESLIKEYGRARAVIFTPELEYGLVPLESNAAGTPVIAFGKGSIRETMVPYNIRENNISTATSLFYYKQNKDSLIQAIKLFEKINFNRLVLTKHASRFSGSSFKNKLRSLISERS